MRRLVFLLVGLSLFTSSCITVQGAAKSTPSKKDAASSPSSSVSPSRSDQPKQSPAPAESSGPGTTPASDVPAAESSTAAHSDNPKNQPEGKGQVGTSSPTTKPAPHPCRLLTATDFRELNRPAYAEAQETVVTRADGWTTITCQYGTTRKILFGLTIDQSREHTFWQQLATKAKAEGEFQWILGVGDDAFRSKTYTRAVRKGTVVMTFSTNSTPMWDWFAEKLAQKALSRL